MRDCNKASGAVDTGHMNIYGDNPCVEFFNYINEKRKDSGPQILSLTIDKNISVYIEKKIFTQEGFGANPFGIIMQQQFYEVQPDPRNCTTLITDKNIYSSKIIWADNIMTMRRDLNVVGGTVDTLGYEYAMLKQIVNNMVEQMRIQSVYNEYTQDLRDVLSVTGTILNMIRSAMAFESALSTLH